jgi:hypothetical protein
MHLVIAGPEGPGEWSPICGIHSFIQRFLRGAVLEHTYHAYKLRIYLLQILFSDLLVGNALPEHIGQIKSEMSARPETTTHQNSYKLEQTKVIGAVGFRVYDPF